MHTVTLSDPSTGNSATIAIELGFNCYSWQVHFADGLRDLLWAELGFDTGKKRPSGSGIPLLFPFPGRIGNAQFTYDGKSYSLPHDDARPHALHGFVFDRPWRVMEQSETKVSGTFHAAVDDDAILDHWPSDFSVEATYELLGNELRFQATFTNRGETPLPWGFGTHAYFRLPLAEGSNTADTHLQVPVDAEWLMDDMIPTGELAELPPDLVLATGLALGDRQFDTPYRLIATDADVQTVLSDSSSGRRVVQSFNGTDFPHAVVYTPGHREAICIEPYSCVPDPFRLEANGIASGLRTLGPGRSYETGFTLRAE